jgi:hypothetical protein
MERGYFEDNAEMEWENVESRLNGFTDQQSTSSQVCWSQDISLKRRISNKQ